MIHHYFEQIINKRKESGKHFGTDLDMGGNGRILVAQPLANSEKLCYDWDKQSRVTKRTVKNLSYVVLSEEDYAYGYGRQHHRCARQLFRL